jgi:flagellar biosynthesis/type III secretory pathway M-ring protein FliF/YscJ
VWNDVVAGIVWSLAPTVLVGLLFWVIMRSIIRADRTERKVYSRMEAEERARRGLPHKP